MKIGKTLLLILSCTYVGVPFAQSDSAVPGIQQRIISAHEEFQQALENAPEKEVEATMFFTNDMALEQLQMSLRNVPLTVKGFLHGTPSYGGGYTLNPGETLDQAIANYRRDHLGFLRQRMQLEDRMAATESNEEARKALIPHRKEAEQMESDFELRGIRVIGLELHGKAKEMAGFKEKNSFVRVIELKKDGKPQLAILPSMVNQPSKTGAKQ